jgi:small subunit ribosomal protein S20
LANIKSARKRARQNITRRAHNVALRSRMRTAIKRVLKAVSEGNRSAAEANFKAAVPEIDRMVTKGIVRKNRAAQYKSRLNAKIRSMT